MKSFIEFIKHRDPELHESLRDILKNIKDFLAAIKDKRKLKKDLVARDEEDAKDMAALAQIKRRPSQWDML